MVTQPASELYTTRISQAEILYGIARSPEGRRRTALAMAGGKPIEKFDALTAVTVLAGHADVATRDRGRFSDCNLAVIDPWMAP